MMEKRTVHTEKIRLNGLTYSAIFNIGDTKLARPRSKGIAVQKEGASFQEDHGADFNEYELFQQKANWPPPGPPVQKKTIQHRGTIQVNRLNIIGVTQSAIFQVGSINQVDSEARLKHTRKYLSG